MPETGQPKTRRPKTILVLQGHPDPAGLHLCHALADAYAQGAEGAGHKVLRVDVAKLDFPLLRSQDAFAKSALPESLAEAGAALQKADHVALFFPLWLGTMPALLKGFLEQLLRPGLALDYGDGGFPKGLLKGRSARVVATMGMPGFALQFWFLDAGLAVLKRNILGLTGIGPIRTTRLGMVEAVSAERRQAWLDQMRALGAAAR